MTTNVGDISEIHPIAGGAGSVSYDQTNRISAIVKFEIKKGLRTEDHE